VTVLLRMVLALAVTAGVSTGCSPSSDRYVDITEVPASPRPAASATGASTGTWTEHCGRNEERHLNADNPVMSPGIVAGAHHVHEYVGNTSTDAHSTETSLAAAPTTCANGDRSTFYWPVLRLTDRPGHDEHAAGGGAHGNTGEVLPPAGVTLTLHGSPVGPVLPLPRGLKLVTGDPMAVTRGSAEHVRASWSCSGFEERRTTSYPRCPAGSLVLRSYDFPSCWDGRNTDSASHRTHAVFPDGAGTCPPRTFPVTRLEVVVAYDVPPGEPFLIDSFPEEVRDPSTDHALYVNVMPEQLAAEAARCVNEGRRCS
jgi:hypothetical protein